jgi:hypothetical protein
LALDPLNPEYAGILFSSTYTASKSATTLVTGSNVAMKWLGLDGLAAWISKGTMQELCETYIMSGLPNRYVFTP